jgi:hypothetical protein
MKFPSIKDVATILKELNNTMDSTSEEALDIRLHVWEDGTWTIHTGDSQYDQDHRGFWGSSSLMGKCNWVSIRDIARDLLDQVREDYAMDTSVIVSECRK